MTKLKTTRTWAEVQRDDRPAEYRWRPLLNVAKFGCRPLLECRAVQQRWQYRRAQDLDAKWILHLEKFHYAARAPENVYSVPAQETAKHRAKFG